MSKWKTIDSAPMGVTVWAKVEGTHPFTGEPYGNAKVMLAMHPTKGVVANHAGVNCPNWLPIAGDLGTIGNWPLTHWKPVKQSKWSVKNPGKLKLKDMSEEDAYEVFKAWWKDVGADEKTLYVYDWDGYWVEYLNDLLCPYSIYRVKRQDAPEGVVKDACSQRVEDDQEHAPLWEIDWNKVDKCYNWAAVDPIGDVYAYEDRPEMRLGGNYWAGELFTFMGLNSPSDIIKKPLENTEENWKKSLIKRPEGV